MAPPKGGGVGPKPMTANMKQSNAQSPDQDDVNAQNLANDMSAIYDVYTKFETNQKLRAENEGKFNLMLQKMKSDGLQMLTLQKLQSVI